MNALVFSGIGMQQCYYQNEQGGGEDDTKNRLKTVCPRNHHFRRKQRTHLYYAKAIKCHAPMA